VFNNSNEDELMNTEVKQNRDEKGATMVEYALMIALVAVVCIVAVSFLGTQASEAFSRIGSSVGVANS
jgi:pilus assembly protein Flp/PilA